MRAREMALRFAMLSALILVAWRLGCFDYSLQYDFPDHEGRRFREINP